MVLALATRLQSEQAFLSFHLSVHRPAFNRTYKYKYSSTGLLVPLLPLDDITTAACIDTTLSSVTGSLLPFESCMYHLPQRSLSAASSTGSAKA
jgi:hypothetical protein